MASLIEQGKGGKVMTFDSLTKLTNIFCIAGICISSLYVISIIVWVGDAFIRVKIIPMISCKSRPQYKRAGVVVVNKERTNYHICVLYKRKQYHFYNKSLYNSAKIGEFLYVPVCEKDNRLYIKHDSTVCKSRKAKENG